MALELRGERKVVACGYVRSVLGHIRKALAGLCVESRRVTCQVSIGIGGICRNREAGDWPPRPRHFAAVASRVAAIAGDQESIRLSENLDALPLNVEDRQLEGHPLFR